MQKAFKLRGQHHVHEDRRQQKSENQIDRRLVQYFYRTEKTIRKIGRKASAFDDVRSRARRLIERKIGRVVGIDGDLKLAVEPLDARRPKPLLDDGDVIEPHLPDFG